jgi:hypothetical protein
LVVGRGDVGGGLDLGFLLGCWHSWIFKGSGGGENERDNKDREWEGEEEKTQNKGEWRNAIRALECVLTSDGHLVSVCGREEFFFGGFGVWVYCRLTIGAWWCFFRKPFEMRELDGVSDGCPALLQ